MEAVISRRDTHCWRGSGRRGQCGFLDLPHGWASVPHMAIKGGTTRKVAGKPKEPAAKKPARAGKVEKERKPAPAALDARGQEQIPSAIPLAPAPATAVELISEPELEAPGPAPAGQDEAGEGGEAEEVSFQGVLRPRQPAGTHILLTDEQSARFPGQGIVRVTGTVGGVAIQSSLMPMGDGTRGLRIHKDTLEQGGFHHGDAVEVALRLDTSSREVVVPKDFLEALDKSPVARRTFAGYAFSHRKEYVSWIEEARQPETRQRRIDQAVRMIEAHEKLS